MLLRKRCAKGFTLIELIVVISIVGISAIAVPAYGGYVKKAKQEVCKSDCLQLERVYEMYLEIDGIEHSEAVFQQYLQEYSKDICPENGVITCVDGTVKCSVHTEVDDESDEGDVPFL